MAGGVRGPLISAGSSPRPPALADFDEPKRSTFVMFGVLTIAVRIYHDRWGYGVYSGPIGVAVLVIATKWVRTAWACPPRPPHPSARALRLPPVLPKAQRR